MERRSVLKMFGAGAATLALRPLWAAPSASTDEFFVFVHASGGWDVTLWADPRNEKLGLVAPAKTPLFVVSLLNTELRRIIDSQDVKRRLGEAGFEAFSSAGVVTPKPRWVTISE